MENVRCIDCHHSKITKNGFAKCSTNKEPGWFPSPVFVRDCQRFRPADAEGAALRRAQYEATGGRALAGK